ncbi:hypothetical protein [Flavivirga rizhaonensis]|uniref:Uncharacterized protein n=1 Tax=Flavivirga rizhaonensis TaxID=2559571 RepID=A0A4S1DZN3_9FLAO|nr:hypothetical protein [Flavivirga rizhaonensis]TGV03629.1 hypothetical protein EM932_06280 [Flavivirga rizhaonensis]
MINTYALTDYDVYNEGAFDDYRRSFRRNTVRRRVPPRRFTTKKSGRYRATGIPKRIGYPRVARKVVKRKRVVYKPPIGQFKGSRKIPTNVLRSKSLLKQKQYPRIVRSIPKKKHPTYRPILKRSKTSPKIPVNVLRPMPKTVSRPQNRKVLVRQKPQVKRFTKPIIPNVDHITTKNSAIKKMDLSKNNLNTDVQKKPKTRQTEMSRHAKLWRATKIYGGVVLGIGALYGIYKLVKNKRGNGHISTNTGTGL